jgi:biotin carboxyl carrier protein
MTRYFVSVQGVQFEVEIDPSGVRVDGEVVEASLSPVPATRQHSLLVDDASWGWVVERSGQGRWALHAAGSALEVEAMDERTRAIRSLVRASAAQSGPRPLRAPMPGLVVRVEVAEGDVVQVGDGVIVMEAMKMENELRAAAAGRVSRILVTPGSAVEKDQVLVEFAPLAEEGGDV